MRLTTEISFSLLEWLSLVGLIQSIYILVYIIFRANNWARAALTVCYFLISAVSFVLQHALRFMGAFQINPSPEAG